MLLSPTSPLLRSIDSFSPAVSGIPIPTPSSHLPIIPPSPHVSSVGHDEPLREMAHTPYAAKVDVSDCPYQSPVLGLVTFQDLPTEIHEAVLDHLFGVRGSALSSISPAKAGTGSWSKALRHPRRKALSDLALVSPLWRPLVQERIYRHIQIRGTTEDLEQCVDWFLLHPYLSPYVRHIEFIVPVWGDRIRKTDPLSLTQRNRMLGNEITSPPSMPSLLQAVSGLDNFGASYLTGGGFKPASSNASLQRIFSHVALLFPDARILTLESGDCKKAPMIDYFDCHGQGQADRMQFEVLPNIQSFILKGAWNVVRDYDHWRNLSDALPDLRELHCAYAKARPEVHMTMAKILTTLPKSLIHLNISLDGLCSKDSGQTHLFDNNIDYGDHQHICPLFGQVTSQLSSLTFTGKVCSNFFTNIHTAAMTSSAISRLRSVDLVVTSCCRDHTNGDKTSTIHELSGVTNMTFIKAFE